MEKSERDIQYKIHQFAEIVEAVNHIEAGEPMRGVHHFLKAGFPYSAFGAYKMAGGKAKTVREMLIESREITKMNDRIDWITPMYTKEFDLS